MAFWKSLECTPGLLWSFLFSSLLVKGPSASIAQNNLSHRFRWFFVFLLWSSSPQEIRSEGWAEVNVNMVCSGACSKLLAIVNIHWGGRPGNGPPGEFTSKQTQHTFPSVWTDVTALHTNMWPWPSTLCGSTSGCRPQALPPNLQPPPTATLVFLCLQPQNTLAKSQAIVFIIRGKVILFFSFSLNRCPKNLLKRASGLW